MFDRIETLMAFARGFFVASVLVFAVLTEKEAHDVVPIA